MTPSSSDPQEWTIEPFASIEDIDRVLDVERASFTRPWTRDMYLAELENRDVSFLYLARNRAREVIAFCCFWKIFDELHINNLAVVPEARGRGLGTALLLHVLDQGNRLGADRALLEVRESNVAARRLYERLGFAVSGTRPGYYTQPTEDALLLTARLPLLPG
jgi:ribosomal-protein-alanine N-acetyltransferase